MHSKKYKITIKMVKEVTMNYEHINMKQAKKDVQRVIENSTNDNLNRIFNATPKFIYKIEII